MSWVRGSLNATTSGKTDQVSCALARDQGVLYKGSGCFILASMRCVKAFRSTFRATSFQDLHWLQKLGSCTASIGAIMV